MKLNRDRRDSVGGLSENARRFVLFHEFYDLLFVTSGERERLIAVSTRETDKQSVVQSDTCKYIKGRDAPLGQFDIF